MDLRKAFEQIKKNEVVVEFASERTEDLPTGASKFGGKPDLPKDFEWYYYDYDFDGETKSYPLSFLAQINCEEASKYDDDKMMPEKGILYFFYEFESMIWGYDPKDKGCAKVYYYDGDISELVSTDFPEDMIDDYKLPQIKIGFSKQMNVPNYEEFAEYNNYNNWDEYEEIKVMEGYEEQEAISKLLGYADIIQNEMLLECEKVTNGIYCGDIPKINKSKLKQLKEDSKQWQLLFQLDTVTLDDFELMFGDCGRIYFYIKKDDLKNLVFDNCWLILQCS